MKTKPAGVRTCLYNAAQLGEVLNAMALQLAGLLVGKERLMVVGILRRGAPLAEILHQKLSSHFSHANIPLMHLQIKRYADDLKLLHPETKLTENPRSHCAGFKRCKRCGSGRGLVPRTLPPCCAPWNIWPLSRPMKSARWCWLTVRSDIAGVRLDVAPSDIIECNVPPYEDEFKIELLQSSSG